MNTPRTAPDVAPEGAWFKSSYSNEQGQVCVEVADLRSEVGVRDSKDKSGPALVVPAAAWSSFVLGVRTGRIDHHPAG
ncbi:DUF397 domain-containing protein [Streptomyces sp. B1866]|uniref:DUF397 domain-containing protein n=1 Tax=Streptomyces sp. B1866 TaxID=3075431 RepID=UPI00288CF410|nr:DUF397 domain-containing protein [Streptomyces sp. B1866]MDT3397009.1 DUF397 domain-containing protein [Streptomyces sp. B1866]